jgi:hypothetical protein
MRGSPASPVHVGRRAIARSRKPQNSAGVARSSGSLTFAMTCGAQGRESSLRDVRSIAVLASLPTI